MKKPKDKPFELKSNTSGFASRTENVFSLLDKVEARHNISLSRQGSSNRNRLLKNDPVVADEEIIQTNSRRRTKVPNFRNCRNRVPGFKMNPSKWKKYSLADVSDMSERSNQRAALDFLKNLKNEKSSESMPSGSSNNDLKTLFLKPSPIKSDEVINEKISFKNSKICMPEYVIGMKKPSSKRKSNMKLSDENDFDKINFNNIVEDDKEYEQSNPEESCSKDDSSLKLATFKSVKKRNRSLRNNPMDSKK